MPELEDERFVRELFERLYGVQLRKVPESDTKTFDFELLAGARRVAAVEVKTLIRVPRTAENGWVQDANGSMTRPDNGAARVGAIIHEAYKQLATATEAKVLVIVNDDSLDFLDLREALNGYLAYGTGESRYKSTAARKIANGRIRDEKLRIDLYIWLNRYEGRYPHRSDGQPLPLHQQRDPLFVLASEAGHGLARTFFGAPETPKPDEDPDADLPTLTELLRREAYGTRR